MSDEILDIIGDAKISFGLEQQGHIQTIERMLDEVVPWEFIAEEIGWDMKTAMHHYVEYLRKELEEARAALKSAYEEGWLHGWNSDAVVTEVDETMDFTWGQSNAKYKAEGSESK